MSEFTGTENRYLYIISENVPGQVEVGRMRSGTNWDVVPTVLFHFLFFFHACKPMSNTAVPIMSNPPIRGAGNRFKRGGFHAARAQANPTRSLATTQPGLIVKTTDSTPVPSGISTPAGIDRPRFRDFNGLSPEIFPSLPFETCTEVS